jgi:hypothetical protein
LYLAAFGGINKPFGGPESPLTPLLRHSLHCGWVDGVSAVL